MATEIERKFLVRNDRWRDDVHQSMEVRQGYLGSDERSSVRVRITDVGANINVKSATMGVSRSEYEYSIPVEDAREILRDLCRKPLLEKTRHLLRYAGHVWEIDVFSGDNSGLVVAEIELASADEPFERPPWVGDEVSGDRRYYNACLIEHPYKDW